MNIDIVNGVTVTEDVNLRRCRVHNKGGCAGILAALSVHGGLLNALSVCGRLLSALNVRGGLIAALVIHGGLLEGPDPCLLDNGGLGRQIYMINSVHFNNMTTRNQEQYQDWYLEWER